MAKWSELLEVQKELEAAAVADGIRAYTRRVEEATRKGRGTTQGAMLTLFRRAIEPVERGLEKWLEESTSKRGPRHTAVKWVQAVGCDVAAYITARVVLDSLYRPTALGGVAGTIARHLLDELKWRRFATLAPGLFRYKMDGFRTTSVAHMARSLNASLGWAVCDECRGQGRSECPHLDCSDLNIPRSQQTLLGTKLIEIFIATTGLATTEHRATLQHARKGKAHYHTTLVLVPTPGTVQWLQKRNDALSELFPPARPMVVPPLKWGPGERGGYRFALRDRHPFVRGASKSHQAALSEACMPMVYEAVNRIQETPWRINQRVLDVVQELIRRGGGRAGLPLTEDQPLPPRPVGEWATDEERKQSPEWRAWRKKAGEIRDANARRVVKARETLRVVQVAEDVREYQAIWWPHNLDFRGRVYPVSSALSPQGDDLQRGLLTFAEAKPMGPEGGYWLALHGANALGEWRGERVATMTLAERFKLIQSLTEDIVEVAEDPLGTTWWEDAKEPWQFLAFCFEWAGFYEAWKRGEGDDYMCSLPVSVDGSCNGIQHFTAMFRDLEGAKAVNVYPNSAPADVYQRIAEYVQGRVEEDARAGDPVAALWLDSGLIGRDLTKRPTMTFGYGSRRFGFQKQIREYLHSLGPEIRERFQVQGEDGKPQDVRQRACVYMAGLIWDALQGVVVSAFEGMDWMQRVAREIAKGGQTVRWTVPLTGFPVEQGYYERKAKQIKTTLLGRIIQPTLYEDTPTVSRRRQVNGIAPNVIHSLDAAALVLTVTACSREQDGMSFAMVHDSYGTVPGDAALLNRVLREQFVRLYTEVDVVQHLARQWAAQIAEVGGEMPEPPEAGDLDLSGVMLSDYFFC